MFLHLEPSCIPIEVNGKVHDFSRSRICRLVPMGQTVTDPFVGAQWMGEHARILPSFQTPNNGLSKYMHCLWRTKEAAPPMFFKEPYLSKGHQGTMVSWVTNDMSP